MYIRVAVFSLVSMAMAGCASLSVTKPAPFELARDGQARARIVIAESAPPSIEYAAQELQRFLGEMTGGNFEIVRDSERPRGREIVLGDSKRFQKAARGTIDLASLGKEGYVIRSSRSRLIIAGGEPRGTLYGVYGLLEDHLGCRWFTPAVSRIPESASRTVGPIDEKKVPVLEYREPFVADCFDGDWAARNRMNSSTARLEEKHGGKVTYFGFVHTFESLVPPDVYFDSHPEYYSLVKGERIRERSQLCCTNEDVVRIVIEEVRKRMREHPEAMVFSVSQNDWYNYCECDRCTAVAEAEGSQIGPVLQLVNRVADAVKDEFPDKAIDTLAYQYTRKPPKNMRPRPNVIIRLCSIECCFAHPFTACDSEDNKTFVEDVRGWSKMCDRLWVWNYNTSFSNYFCPYPNLHVRNDNIKFYAENNVTGIFEQDVYTTINGELNTLSGYLNAKFLWDPNYDEETALREFLDGVYGAAAAPIRQYIDMMRNRVERDNIHMNIWIGPDHALFTDELLEKADALWARAEAAVATQPDVLERVKIGRLSVDYALIERARTMGSKLYTIDHETGSMIVNKDFAERARRFFDVALRNGVTNIRESQGDIHLYKSEIDRISGMQAGAPIRGVRVSNPKPGLKYRVYEGSWNDLPDFKSLKPAAAGVSTAISEKVAGRTAEYALVFDGYLRVPTDGVYVFGLYSNDGSRLYLGKETLIDHGGLHSASSKPGIARLKKGYHPIRIEYFQAGGLQALDLRCEGPDFQGRSVPPAMLWH